VKILVILIMGLVGLGLGALVGFAIGLGLADWVYAHDNCGSYSGEKRQLCGLEGFWAILWCTPLGALAGAIGLGYLGARISPAAG